MTMEGNMGALAALAATAETASLLENDAIAEEQSDPGRYPAAAGEGVPLAMPLLLLLHE